MSSGSLVCVGIGMTLGSHITPLARSYIEKADVVFAAVSDGVVELWLGTMNSNVRSLQPLYVKGKSRRQTYQDMVECMLSEVRAGKKVCGAFYGHPGIFAWPPHKAIEIARQEGFAAHMEPGVSAEDCLYADLGIDPATFGCQHYEASQFMLYERRIDPSAYLILWQVGVAGDRTFKRFETDAAHRSLLVELLNRDYPLDHQVIVYIAATLPTQRPTIEKITLSELANAAINARATVIIPPSRLLKPNLMIREKLEKLEDE